MRFFDVLSSSMSAMLLGPLIGWALSTALILLGMVPADEAVPIFISTVVIGWIIVMAQNVAANATE